MMREQASNEPQLRHHGQRHSSSISRREAVDSGCSPGSKDCISDNKRTKSATQRPPAPYLSTSSVKKTTFKPVMTAGGQPTIPKVPPFRSNRPSDKVLREMEIKEFYKNYDAMEGTLTAIVLGGFFAFVCLLVMYKTKCRPMWKNRRKRLTTTPATASVAEIDDQGLPGGVPSGVGGPTLQPPVIQQEFHEGCQFDAEMELEEEEEYNFECIPLQSVCNEEEDDDDIYFLDEYGNYVFPLQNEGSCSCPPSAEELNNTLRRVSQVSSVSAPYTVKSLPGAFLYIPVVESSKPIQSVPSLPSVKRALSDPQIHFAQPLSGHHPIILTVNPTSEATSSGVVRRNNSSRKALALQQRSFSVTVEQPPSGLSSDLPPTSEVVIIKQPCKSLLITESIDINVIQPTPNISPSASLTAINDQSANAAGAVPARDATATAVAASKSSDLPEADEPITTNVPASSPVAKKQSSHVRRVSFSEDEVTSVCSDPAGESPHRTRRTSRGGSLATSTRQMTVPMAANATMSYLQVPGQQLVAPHLSTEAVAAQTSPQARRRRATRLLKTGSFCSITSEGDGDIFGDVEPSEEQLTAGQGASPASGVSPEECVLLSATGGRASISTVGSSAGVRTADPLSDYSELHSDGCSDISDLFRKNAQESEAGMSFEDISCEEVPTAVQVQKEGDGNSLYSLSLGSEDNNPREIITVPVTIEHPPPEMRGNLDSTPAQPLTVEAGTQQATPAGIAHHRLDSIEASGSVEASEACPLLQAGAAAGQAASADQAQLPEDAAVETEEGMRMVLVRDIGIQVCGDSPNLNLARKFKASGSGHSHHHHHHHSGHSHSHHKSSKQDSLAEKFPAEILF